MEKLSKHDQIIRAVNLAKKSQFGVKAIKVELEADLDRGCDVEEAHNYIMGRLQNMGLAEVGDEWTTLHSGLETTWEPLRPLTYCEFYCDGSVDSEFTFTLMLDNPENIFLLPKIVEIWNDFCEEYGTLDVRGAGMHMAFLTSGSYPTQPRNYETRFNNFRKSMTMLLPALYFLGASCENSRGLEYRKPRVGLDDHRSAIDYRGGALEFRVFDPCYHTPEMILDNFVVMSRTLKYWTLKYRPGLERICQQAKFGVDYGNDLDRFYATYTHLDLLNNGLKLLKPGYLKTKDIKRQRKFIRDKNWLNKAKKYMLRDSQLEYQEYRERFIWAYSSDVIPKTLEEYVSDRVSELENRQHGEWDLVCAV